MMNQPEHNDAPATAGLALEANVLDELQVTPPGRTTAATSRLTTAAGRQLEVNDEGGGRERLLIRAAGGKVLLQVTFDDDAALIEIEQAEVELRATARLLLSADEVVVRAATKLSLHSGGDMEVNAGGNAHTVVAGVERRESSSVEWQATGGGVDLRARDEIAMDGDHIALNDRTQREMFGWTKLDPLASREPRSIDHAHVEQKHKDEQEEEQP